MRRLLVVAIPAAALPVMMAGPASADADQLACATVTLAEEIPVVVDADGDCAAYPDDTPPHIVGVQVCGPDEGVPGSDDGVQPNIGDASVSVGVNPADGAVWVEGEGDLDEGQGGVTAGSGSTAVGVSDDVGTQCAPTG